MSFAILRIQKLKSFVDVGGTGFSLLERYIVNNNTMNVAGKWKCLQSGFVNVVTPQYSVSLF